MPGRATSIKMGMAEMGAPVSLGGVAVHLDCWCVCLCIFILHQKIQLTRVVPDKVQRAVKWLCVSGQMCLYVCVCLNYNF